MQWGGGWNRMQTARCVSVFVFVSVCVFKNRVHVDKRKRRNNYYWRRGRRKYNFFWEQGIFIFDEPAGARSNSSSKRRNVNLRLVHPSETSSSFFFFNLTGDPLIRCLSRRNKCFLHHRPTPSPSVTRVFICKHFDSGAQFKSPWNPTLPQRPHSRRLRPRVAASLSSTLLPHLRQNKAQSAHIPDKRQ